MATPGINYGPAQPLGDAYNQSMQKLFNVLQMLHILAPRQMPVPSQPVQPLPSAWEQANERSIQQQMKPPNGAKALGSIAKKAR